MNNPFRTDRDHDRDRDRNRWTEQGQDGGYYGDAARSQAQQSGQDWSRDRSHERNSSYAQGQGGYAQSGDHGQVRNAYDQFNRSSPSQGGQSGGSNWGGNYGGSAFAGGDDWNTRSGGHGSYYGQADTGRTGYDQDRSRMGSSGWTADPSPYRSDHDRASQYGRGGSGEGRQTQGAHPDFEPDYLHWREQQMSNYDRDYNDWRSEKREKFSSDFEGWRTARGPRVQAENSVVGDVTDGGGGSQTHAKDMHDDKPAKH